MEKSMKYYKVNFVFEIPVAVKADGNCSDEEAKIDAYYLAREEFPAFSINECSVKMEAITEAQYRDLRVTVNALRKDKA